MVRLRAGFWIGALLLLAAAVPAFAQPAITQVTPNFAIAGTAINQAITVTGSGFVDGAVVVFGTNDLVPTAFVSATSLTATIPVSLLVTAGTVNITVRNPGPLNSPPSVFTIVGVPTISAIAPDNVLAGSPTTLLTITGTNFFSGSRVIGFSAELTPTVNSSTELTVSVPSINFATPGVINVLVRNPGAGDSTTLPFTVNAPPPAPTLSGLNPNSTVAGSPNLEMVVTGTNFVSGAVVLFGTTPLTPSAFSPTQLTVSIPSVDLAVPRGVDVTVRNPDNQLSNMVPFSVVGVTPTLTQISPSSAVAGAPSLQLTLTGTDFQPGAVVLFGATPLNPAPTDIAPTQIVVTVPSTLLALAGDFDVRVRNPGDVFSEPRVFRVAIPLEITYPATITGTRGTLLTAVTPTTTGGTSPYTYALESGGILPDGLAPPNPSTGVISGTPTVAGSSTVRVRVTDSATPPQSVVSQDIVITINNPGLQIVTGSPLPPGTAGTAYTDTLVASGGLAPYAWSLAQGSTLPPGLALSSAGEITGTPLLAGSFTFTVALDDADANVAPIEKPFSLTVSPVISSLNPSFRAAGNTELVLQILGLGFAGGGTTVNFGSTQIAPASVAVTGGSQQSPATTALLTIPGSALTTPGPVSVTVSVGGILSNATTFTVVGDTTITITSESALGTRTSGTAFSVDLEATGGNGNYTWSVAAGSTLPPGLSLNSASGLLNGTLGAAGSYSFTIRVVDNANPGQSTGQKTFTLTVQDFLVSTTALPQARVGIPYSATLAVSGGPTVPTADYQWTLVSGTASLPPGVTFSTATGTFSGSPEPITGTSKNFTIQVSARHTPTGLTTPARTLQLVVTGGGLDISVNSLPFGIVNQPYGPSGTGVSIAPVNGTPPYTIEVNTANAVALRAAGFSVANVVGNPPTLLIAGTPTIAGTFPVQVTVRDAGGTQVTRSLSLLVLANQLVIQPATLPNATVDTDYSQQLSVTGLSAEEQNLQPGQTSAVTWSLLGNVPGVTLSGTTGLLTARFATAGPRQFTVQASTRLRQATRVYTLTVQGPVPAITTTALPAASIGQAYSAEVTAAGGTPGYTWQVAGVTLPAGLSFDAGTVNSANLRIAGTPAAGAQSRTFTLTVRDSAGQTASREFTIAVTTTPIPALSLQPFANPLPAEQKDVVVALAAPYPIALQGTATLTFTPNATNNADDPAVRFLSGQRTANFTIPAGTTQAVFDGVPVQRVQTGTVAGTVRVNIQINGGPSASQEFSIGRSAPFLQDNLTVQTSPNGFTVVITGYSTPRDLSSAQVTFAATSGTNLQTTQLTVPLTDAATQWFQSAPGQGAGSTFRLTIPFTVQNGTNAVASVTVTLSNTVGASNSRTRAVQ